MPRKLLLTMLLAISATGCATARPEHELARVEAPPDPERWERSACLRGAYPYELDDRAYARARQADRQARLQGTPAPYATQMLLEARTAFEARCATWLAMAGLPGRPSPGAAMAPATAASAAFVTVGYERQQ